MGRFDGSRVIITGAASGIGRATALLFAREGARLVLGDLNEEDGTSTEKAAREAGAEAVFLPVDVSKAADVQSVVATAVERYGGLDVMFNNAGLGGRRVSTVDFSEEEFDTMIGVNLKGVFLGLKYGIPAMLDSGGGAIVNTASVASVKGFANLAVYSASKGGVLQLTRSAALEWAEKGIRINAICPGPIETGMTRAAIERGKEKGQLIAPAPVGRYGQPEEVAELVAFLASDASSFCTGGAYMIDGGVWAG